MGIDARMFVRLKGRENWLDPAKELEIAVALARVVGAGNFIITKAFEDWNFGPPHHALSIVKPLTEQDVEDYEVPELVGRVVYFQDGPPIVADEDEQFVEVHLMSRYYAEGYARGDWPTIRAVAEWLEIKFPEGEVWYGGDSGGVLAELFDTAARDDINRYYLTKGHSEYRGAFGGLGARDENAIPVCRCCEQPMQSCGGAGETFWFCDGCDGRAKSKGSDVSFLKRGEDFFNPKQEGTT